MVNLKNKVNLLVGTEKIFSWNLFINILKNMHENNIKKFWYYSHEKYHKNMNIKEMSSFKLDFDFLCRVSSHAKKKGVNYFKVRNFRWKKLSRIGPTAKFLYFAGKNFRWWDIFKYFAGKNFRGLDILKHFAGKNFRGLDILIPEMFLSFSALLNTKENNQL